MPSPRSVLAIVKPPKRISEMTSEEIEQFVDTVLRSAKEAMRNERGRRIGANGERGT